MQNGLYSVNFQTPLGMGAGVVRLDNGNVSGGDAGLFYIGKYNVEGNVFEATVNTGRHTHWGGDSVFGQDEVTIKLEGRFEGTQATLNGTSPMAPGLIFSASLRRVAD